MLMTFLCFDDLSLSSTVLENSNPVTVPTLQLNFSFTLFEFGRVIAKVYSLAQVCPRHLGVGFRLETRFADDV